MDTRDTDPQLHHAPGDPYVVGTGPGQTSEGQDARRRRAWWIGGIGAVVLAVLIVGVLIARQYRPQEVVVVRRDVIDNESLEGRVVAPPNKLAVINCTCSAPVARVFATVGQTVRKNDILVELSHPDAAAAYQAAQSELKTARAADDQARSVYLAEVGQAQTQLAEAQARQRRLAASPPTEVPTGLEQEAGKAASPQNGNGQAAAPENGDRLAAAQQSDYEVGQAQERLAAAQQRMNEYMTPYQQRLASAQTAFKEAQAGRDRSYVRAPIAGQILELNAQPGQSVDQVPNQLVATIADLASLRVHAELTSTQQGLVRTGLPVQLRVNQLPEEVFTGTVQQITTAVAGRSTEANEPLRQVMVVSFINRDGMVKPDMTAHVLVQLARADDVPAVPDEAIERDDEGRTYVGVRQHGDWVRVPVQTGPSDGMHTAILSGVREGQTVRVPRGSNTREVSV